MAKQVKNSDLVQGKLWEPTIKETESLITVLDKLEQSFKDVSKASSQAAKKADPGSAKGISTINEELGKQKRIKSELSKVDKQREAAESRLRIAQSKQGKELERTNQRLLRQRQENRALAKETDNLNSAYGRSSARLTRLTKKYQDLEFQNKGNTREAKRLLRQITFLDAKLKASDKTVGRSTRFVAEYERGFKGLGKGIGAAIGPIVGITAGVAGLAAGLRASVGLFREFGLATAKVQAITGDTSGNLTEQAKSLGVSTAFTASNVAELQLNLSKLGFTTSQIEDSTEAILNFALATDSELGRAAEVTASTLNAFNLEASEAGRISDVAAKAFNSTALDIEKFATAISVVGPAANATGVSIEKTTAILGKIVDAGIDASTAGSALRNVFIDIADKGITLDEALNQISTSQNKLTTANELFGKRGAVVATVIADNVDEIDQLDKSLLNAAGSADAASAIIGDTLDGDIKKFTSSIQGLILGNSGLAKSLRGIIQGFTRLIRLFSDTDEAAKNLIDSNLEQLKTSEENIAKNTELAETYKELSSQENLTTEETEILNGVKGELLSTFDDSIAKINEETGAIEINIEALEEKIAAEVLLSSEAAKNLIAEKARLKIQISLAGSIDKVAKSQLENNTSLSTGVNLALAQIKSAEDYNRVLETLSDTRGKGADQAAEDVETARDLEKVLGRSANAAFLLSSNELDLAKIEGELLDLGIDLNKIAEERVKTQKGLNSEITKTKDLEDTKLKDAELRVEENFQKNKLQLLEESDEKIRAAKEKENATDVSRQKEVEKLQKELALDLNQIEIDRLQDLIEARDGLIEKDDLKQIKLRQELQEKLTEITIEGLEERSEAQKKALEEHNKDIAALEKEFDDAVAARQKKIQEGTVAAIDVLDQAFAKSSDNRINEIDRELQALQDREDALRQAAINGTQIQKDNLATNQRLQAEQVRAREEQVKKAQRREIVLAGIKAFAENAGEPNAVGKTLSDITVLSAALLNLLPGFHDGTDDTGNSGALRDKHGVITGYTHKNEMVLSEDDRGDIGFDKTRSDIKDAFAFQEMHRFDQAPIVQVQRFQSNAEVLQKFDVLAEKLDNLPDRMPRILDEKFDEKSKVYTTVVKTGNNVEKNHKRINGIWG